jgi:hypothetical protein
MPIAAVTGDAAYWQALRAAARSAKTPNDRIVALRGLSGFEDPKLLEQTFDLLLTDEVKMQDFTYLVGGNWGLISRPEAARALFAWLSTHWEQARAKLPGPLAHHWAGLLATACSPEERDAELSFFQPRMADVEGAARPIAENAERATSCAELRARGTSAVTQFLKSRR